MILCQRFPFHLVTLIQRDHVESLGTLDCSYWFNSIITLVRRYQPPLCLMTLEMNIYHSLTYNFHKVQQVFNSSKLQLVIKD